MDKTKKESKKIWQEYVDLRLGNNLNAMELQVNKKIYENATFLESVHSHNVFTLQQGLQINSNRSLILLF